MVILVNIARCLWSISMNVWHTMRITLIINFHSKESLRSSGIFLKSSRSESIKSLSESHSCFLSRFSLNEILSFSTSIKLSSSLFFFFLETELATPPGPPSRASRSSASYRDLFADYFVNTNPLEWQDRVALDSNY
ncbi:hypothetical protein QTP88_001263 [Uroleucon formosanum]